MFKGFKEFLSRGNVIDLAVAVVIGAAFTGLVTAFTEKVVQPLVDRVGAGGDREYGILKISLGGNPEQFLDFNAVLSAVDQLPDRCGGRLLRHRGALQEAQANAARSSRPRTPS